MFTSLLSMIAVLFALSALLLTTKHTLFRGTRLVLSLPIKLSRVPITEAMVYTVPLLESLDGTYITSCQCQFIT